MEVPHKSLELWNHLKRCLRICNKMFEFQNSVFILLFYDLTVCSIVLDTFLSDLKTPKKSIALPKYFLYLLLYK